jgi:hypothetical protein
MVWIGMTVLAAMPMTAQAQMSVGIRGGAVHAFGTIEGSSR